MSRVNCRVPFKLHLQELQNSPALFCMRMVTEPDFSCVNVVKLLYNVFVVFWLHSELA